MVMGSSLIQPQNVRMAILRDWQLELCGGDHCAAMLMNHFDYWHSWKQQQKEKAIRTNKIAAIHGEEGGQDESLLQFHTLEDLSQALMGLFGRNKIVSALKALEEKGFISKHSNPNPRYTFDKTIYYLFHSDVINSMLSTPNTQIDIPVVPFFSETIGVLKRDIDSLEINDRDIKSKPSSFISKLPAFENKRYTKNTYKNTDQDIKAAEAGEPFVSAAAILTKDDLLIGVSLTLNQLEAVMVTVNWLKQDGYFAEHSTQEAVEQIKQTLLSERCYTKAGVDFSLKLNTIKKSIQRHTWSPPIDSIVEEKKEHEKKKRAFQETRRQFIDNIFSQQHLIKQFMEYRDDAEKHGKSLDSFNAVVNQAEEKIRALKKALAELELNSPVTA